MAYTAKDITVLEGLEPVRRRPGMYIGGVGSTGLHHLVWEILDNSIDEAMNGHASNIWVTLHKDGSSITIEDDGRGHTHRQARAEQEERAGGDFHGAPRGRQVRPRQLQDGRRPPRRRRERRQCAVERADRDSPPRRRGMGAAVQAGEAAGAPEEDRACARQRHEGVFPSRSGAFFRRSSSRPPSSASGSKWRATSTRG